MSFNTRLNRRWAILGITLAILTSPVFFSRRAGGQEPVARDPKAWGGNHVGQPVPEYIHGDECLFCHTYTIGTHWQNNAHGVAVRQLEGAGKLQDLLKQPELRKTAGDIDYLMGSRSHIRFLKKEGYGRFQLNSAHAAVTPGAPLVTWLASDSGGWDKNKFGEKCAGCHSTGVDPKTRAFTSFGIDCYACHGYVNPEHSNNTALMILSKKRRNEAQVIESLCAQCHLRGGKSRSTGLPYPNGFIAGDNLFQDFEVDWKKADDMDLNPGDRHVYRNVRDVAVYGKEGVTCISCHQVHTDSPREEASRHMERPRGPICFDCHTQETPIKAPKAFKVSSQVCEY